ncbi:NAD(P)/FAD-dependent oxidoreductase [Frankia sp. CNm7]|uniref:NAD(P)/FAD-dependent oxidoreductase n=1 Tax=Frankia nepalensis TaxID=1836974 RepID=A0A937RHP4_9ACTN|nr:NAD(P)/FAD-dependent oxidoreductase [Frankia nepalensis]MBL7498579.1 NAD(P)/FAD-dependent oxidoreductase [Frankia nepalensis]MBL7515042.1 NAD(P)/FAD-dependent oxidoreductase [Frankia nepalensis]MBL7518986.1 NAD(P)/FAD-dependent oxidoreductase [Frankia nepalensis]MBL7629170.1 NAD(P)/FAD-dependent oxidoreductase [Frankia nepalensis]
MGFGRAPRILVVGGGYVGMYTALRLQRRLRRGEATITVVEPNSYMTYQPFLPEAAAGNLEPRHVVVPLRKVLRRCQVVSGRVTMVAHASRKATVRTVGGDEYDLDYDILVMAPGSVARTLPIPGLGELGVGFKSVAEAIYLRNKVINRMDAAASTADPVERVRALTFVFIGGGYAGIEALAELEDMSRYACSYYPRIVPADLRWVLVEATNRILPEVSPAMGLYTVKQLEHRGIEVRLGTRVTSLTGGHVRLDDGTEFDADTIVWTAGVRANPVLGRTDLPLDDRGRLRATPFLQVDGVADAWTAGDCAAVPDLTGPDGATTSPSAQHAVRQARRLADNLVAHLRGHPIEPYAHKYAGSVASLGFHRGVADVYGVKLRGWPAWLMHRTYHLSRLPTFNRKARVMADWTLSLFFEREIVSLGSFADPRAEFRRATAAPAPTGAAAPEPARVSAAGRASVVGHRGNGPVGPV